MIFKKKGQGALEYLLLIGGAVLIAVIVIALLVGMGGQSRDTAQNQATQAQQALEQPQSASIISLTAEDCNSSTNPFARFTVNWQPLGEGGTHTLRLYDHSGDSLNVDVNGLDVNWFTPPSTDSATVSDTSTVIAASLGSGNNCEDTYWGEIRTEKNGQFVNSTRMRVNFEADN
jgi:hypothetical protein